MRIYKPIREHLPPVKSLRAQLKAFYIFMLLYATPLQWRFQAATTN